MRPGAARLDGWIAWPDWGPDWGARLGGGGVMQVRAPNRPLPAGQILVI